MIKQIKKLEPQVELMLRQYPRLRDDDNALYINLVILTDETLKTDVSVNYFFANFVHGKYPSFESVSRARRKVQEKFEELRGDKYNKRKEKEQEVRQGINE